MAGDADPGAPPPEPRPRVPLLVEKVLVGGCMAAIALITAANVATRYLTNVSLAFTEEYSVALMVALALAGTALATAAGRNIRVGLLVDAMPPRGRRAAEIAAMALVVLCFGLLAWYGARMALDEWEFEALTPGLGNPQWIYTATLPALSLLVIARAFGRILRLARGEDG